MGSQTRVEMELLEEKDYRRVICYPRCVAKELERRLEELKKLGITSVEFSGRKRVANIPVLGKGCVGVVVVAYRERRKAALKIRRTDADRSTMQHEAQMLKKANKAGVGPRLLAFSENFLLMEFVEGLLLPEWLKRLEGEAVRLRLDSVLLLLLEQCWQLDKIGVDHGELSHAPKHIIITPEDTPYLLDFETASASRRVANVTSLCQYLFFGSQIASRVRNVLGVGEKELLAALRVYKRELNRENFEIVLRRSNIK